MKPFDLEAAKRGDPIVTRDGREAFFVGICKGERPIVVCDSAGNLTRLLHDGDYTANGEHINDIFMALKKRTVWLVVLGYREARVYETQSDANGAFPSFKAYPVEIEE